MSDVYIRTDQAGRIVACDGGYSACNGGDWQGWIFLDTGEGDRYNLCQSHYFPGGLYTDEGIPRWRYSEDGPCLRTQEELSADQAGQTAPTELDDLSALLIDHELRLTLLELEV